MLVIALLFAGCAPLPQPGTGTPPARPAPPATTPVPRSEPPRPAPSVAPADSAPSADAERVLSTIPEPLGGAPQSATPSPRLTPSPSAATAARDTAAKRAVAPADAYDTLRTSRPNDDVADVPVPAPTTPLRSSPVTLDSAAAPAPPADAPPPAASPPATSSPAPSTPAPPPRDPNAPCWRVQVAAPDEREKADSRMAAAQSLLLVSMVIERERGLFKVRTRDCQTREAADALRRRAIDSGFDGAFVIKSAPPR
jgi:hypothetical protein